MHIDEVLGTVGRHNRTVKHVSQNTFKARARFVRWQHPRSCSPYWTSRW